ncbi:MAG: hypothetical protein HQK51_18825 [Oligoflexia bacterium]|nr:hypothetical protein [Oligoflexia bacterium]
MSLDRALCALLGTASRTPSWYNINYFYADALNILGRYDDALMAFKDMYRKQESPVNEKEVADFIERTKKVKDKIVISGGERGGIGGGGEAGGLG